MRLTSEQNTAVQKLSSALNGGLIGKAGTGKSFSTSVLADLLIARGKKPILCAPTHKAARVLSVKTGRVVTTLHSLLKLVPVPNNRDGGRTLRAMGSSEFEPKDVLLIDEASMLSQRLLDIVSDVMVNVILIGDSAQLPPVGFTRPVFMDWLKGNRMPVSELKTIMRQSSESTIPFIAEQWRPGGPAKWPTVDNLGSEGGLYVMSRPKAMGQFADHAAAHAKSGESSDTVCPWLTYTNAAAQQAGMVARTAMFGNRAMAEPFIKGELCVTGNPLTAENVLVLPTSMPVRVLTDPVPVTIHKLNDQWQAYTMEIKVEDTGVEYEIMTMQFGERKALMDALKEVAMDAQKAKRHAAEKAAWDEFYSIDNSILDLRSIYASTIHKSQGSTFLDVFIDKIDLSNYHADSIRSGLFYTALTRTSGYAVLAK